MNRIRALASLALAPPPAQAAAAETLCDWFANSTPGNHWLTDRDGTRVLATQGQGSAPGLGDLPPSSFAFADWIAANGSHGFGRACIQAKVARGGALAGRVRRVALLAPLPITRCKEDSALPEPDAAG